MLVFYTLYIPGAPKIVKEVRGDACHKTCRYNSEVTKKNQKQELKEIHYPQMERDQVCRHD